MRKVTLRLPTKHAMDLGLVNPRFFEHNESLEVLHTFAAGGSVTQVVRIRRRGELPPNEQVARRRGELLGRYALRHFEVLARDEARREVTALITWRIPRALAAIVEEFGADLVPAEPFVVGPEEAVVTFYAAEERLSLVYGLLDDLRIKYKVSAVRPFRGERGPLAGVTDRQRTLLELAFRLGYFDTPAKTSLAKLAKIAGVSRAAVSKTLRRAEARLLDSVLGEAGGSRVR